VEMVTAPDFRSADEAAQYLIRLRQLLRWIGISEADMEKGHLRCDANVSIRHKGEEHLNPKTEIKNVNSIDAVRDAIAKEIDRQVHEVEEGHKIQAWTLEWDEDTGKLKKMRSKETEADYRYFHEPDLLPIHMEAAWQKEILKGLPELPLERRKRFMEQYQLPLYDADILTQERKLSDYFEATVKTYSGDPKKVSNWLMNDILRMLNDKNIPVAQLKTTPIYLAELIQLVDEGKINTSTAKSILEKIELKGISPREIVETEGLGVIKDDAAIRSTCQEVIAESPNEVTSYKGGKIALMGWFVGQVMKKMRGKADPQLARTILEEFLSK
jgi:aspartyl-tRNA(Asn)/glutamyl-tRNA(Gln) amidotransferase subunit B